MTWSDHSWSIAVFCDPRNVSKLERIQRRATMLILKTNDDYKQKKRKNLNLLSLEQERFLLNALFLFKVLNGYLWLHMYSFSQILIGIL